MIWFLFVWLCVAGGALVLGRHLVVTGRPVLGGAVAVAALLSGAVWAIVAGSWLLVVIP